jgi:uncharacterized membrane protein (DUF485 family)
VNHQPVVGVHIKLLIRSDMETNMIELSRDADLSVEDPAARPEKDARVVRSASVVDSPSFTALMRFKRRLVAPLLGFSLIYITSLALLSGYGRSFMAMKVSGAMNVGYLMVFLTYILCWVVSVVYVQIANRNFETLSESVNADLKNRSGS